MVNLTEFINKWKGKLCIAKKKITTTNVRSKC